MRKMPTGIYDRVKSKWKPWNKGKSSWNKGKKCPWAKNNPQIFKKGHIPWIKGKKRLDIIGEKNPNFKGKVFSGNGYIEVYSPNHPFKNSHNCVFEHRLVMERILGRYLTKQEIVHHKNGIRDDNRPENLMLCVRNKHWHSQACPKCGFEFVVE